MGRGRPKKRKDPPEDNIDEPQPKSSKQKESSRETSARSNKINYKMFVGMVEFKLFIFYITCNLKIQSLQKRRTPMSVPFARIGMIQVVKRIG